MFHASIHSVGRSVGRFGVLVLDIPMIPAPAHLEGKGNVYDDDVWTCVMIVIQVW